MSSSLPETPALRERRERTISALCEHFARDRLSLDEFEKRLDLANSAQLPAQLDALLHDIEAPSPAVVVAPPRPPASALEDNRFIVSVMSGAERRGNWRPGSRNHVVTIMGGAVLDFRDTPMPRGVTDVFIFACMGGVEIIVPPDLAVESHGFALMGGFGHSSEVPPPGPDAPVLRIHGFALMGGVDIQVRLPGETARDARRRRREDKRMRRIEGRHGRGGI